MSEYLRKIGSKELSEDSSQLFCFRVIFVTILVLLATKDKLILKANFLVLIETKKPTKLFFDFCPNTLKLGYPISLLTPKTAPLCPSKDLRGPAPWHPEVYRAQP